MALDIPPATYNAHERAEAAGGRDYGPDEAAKYARRFGVDDVWLLTGKGHRPSADRDHNIVRVAFDDHGKEITDGVSTASPYKPKMRGGMPVIDVSAGAGPGGLPIPVVTEHGGVVYSADAVRGEIVMPPFMIGEFSHVDPRRIHWHNVRGDSMESTLDGGDYVAVDTTDTAIGQGGVFVLRDEDGEILVKRLRKTRNDAAIMVEIISDNPKQGREIVDANRISVIGRVIARLCRVG